MSAKTITVANQKGGVGKTNIVFNLSGALAEMRKKLLLVDVDQQGNLSSLFMDDIAKVSPTTFNLFLDLDLPATSTIYKTPFPEIDIIPSNDQMSAIDLELANEPDAIYFLNDKLKLVKEKYDYILIDCPPSLALPTQAALVAADSTIIPLECQELAIKGTIRLIESIRKVRERANPGLKVMGYVISKYDRRRKLEENYRQAVLRSLRKKVFPVELADNVKYTEAVSFKKPITMYLPYSEQADAYRKFAREVINHG